uniref:Uncharacterized protein n=1 Tax=Populus trichocarpa TaxID=3694 RepID=U7E2R8_POPTR
MQPLYLLDSGGASSPHATVTGGPFSSFGSVFLSFFLFLVADGSRVRAEVVILGQSPLQRGGGLWLVGSPKMKKSGGCLGWSVAVAVEETEGEADVADGEGAAAAGGLGFGGGRSVVSGWGRE